MLQTQVYGEDYLRQWDFHETRKYFSHAEKGWSTVLKTMITSNKWRMWLFVQIFISLDNFTLYRNIHNSEQRILTNPNNTDLHFCSKENNWYELIYFNNYFQTLNIHFIISHFDLSKKIHLCFYIIFVASWWRIQCKQFCLFQWKCLTKTYVFYLFNSIYCHIKIYLNVYNCNLEFQRTCKRGFFLSLDISVFEKWKTIETKNTAG